MADAFFGPLQQLLGRKYYMLSEDQPSSLDCVALAYIALAYIPQMPQPWVAESMKARYPQLCEYVNRMTKTYFGGTVDIRHAFPSLDDDQARAHSNPHADDSKTLPWRRPDRKGFSTKGAMFLIGASNSLPLAEHFPKNNVRIGSEVAEGQSLSAGYNTLAARSDIVPPLLAVGSVVAMIGAYLFYSGIHSGPAAHKSALSDMGEAGAMLDMATFGGYSNRPVEEIQRPGRVPVGLEVDVQVDENRAQ